MLALTLDITIVVLLLISLGAGLRLHSALKIIRVEGNEFQPMIQSLDKATSKADATLGRLRKMAEDVGVKLNDEAKNTQRLINELDFMTKRADQLAEKLDDSIGEARSVDKKMAKLPKATDAAHISDVEIPSSQPRRRVPDLEQKLKNLR